MENFIRKYNQDAARFNLFKRAFPISANKIGLAFLFFPWPGQRLLLTVVRATWWWHLTWSGGVAKEGGMPHLPVVFLLFYLRSYSFAFGLRSVAIAYLWAAAPLLLRFYCCWCCLFLMLDRQLPGPALREKSIYFYYNSLSNFPFFWILETSMLLILNMFLECS